MVTKNRKLFYSGNEEAASALESQISDYAEINDVDSWGNYLDKNTEHLIKQREFELSDGCRIGIYLVTNVVDVIPEVKSLITEMFLSSAMILLPIRNTINAISNVLPKFNNGSLCAIRYSRRKLVFSSAEALEFI